MTLDELSQVLMECQKALAELKESKKEGKWKPKQGEKYWIVDCCGEVDDAYWEEDSIDIWRYKNMPLFKTKEECERYWHFMDTVKEKSYSFSKEEWDDDSFYKYEIYYDRNLQEFIVLETDNYKVLGGIYFRTYEDAQYIIDNFKEELMEYWL